MRYAHWVRCLGPCAPSLLTRVGTGALVAVQLCAKGAEVNAAVDNGQTSVHMACAKGHLDTVHCLLQRGARLTVTDLQGHTPLQVAAPAIASQVQGATPQIRHIVHPETNSRGRMWTRLNAGRG